MFPRAFRRRFTQCQVHLSVQQRCLLTSSQRGSKDDKTDEVDPPVKPKRTQYPNIKLPPRFRDSVEMDPLENPISRTHRIVKHDYDKCVAALKGLPMPRSRHESDILIVGGGILGASIAHHLLDRTGHGLRVTVVEKDPPQFSSSLNVAHNSLYQQVKAQAYFEMAQYAADFYRTIGRNFDSTLQLPTVDFLPNSSLLLASEKEASALEVISSVYRKFNWNHQLLSPTLLKKKFPWLNVDGVQLACLGMNMEGVIDQWKATAAMRARAIKLGATFIQGNVIGCTYIDLSQFSPDPRGAFAPRQVHIHRPNGEVLNCKFGRAILATGASTKDVLQHFVLEDVNDIHPIQAKKLNSYVFESPDSPCLDMPMIMEPNGIRVRKCDLLGSYVVWDEENCEDLNEPEKLEADERLFHEKLLPHLVHRVPSFENSKLVSSSAGAIEKCTWDDNMLFGVTGCTGSIYVIGGLANDEVLYAPALGRAMAEATLDGGFIEIDLNCYRSERIRADVKLNEYA